VCHFYTKTNPFCAIVDKHLNLLARKHMEARFVKIDAEKAPYLVENLNIFMMPTILLTKDNQTVDRVEGLDSLGGTEDFSTECMAWRLSLRGVIEYSGSFDPLTMTAVKKKKAGVKSGPRTVRTGGINRENFSSDEEL
jgi:hypothetical protein